MPEIRHLAHLFDQRAARMDIFLAIYIMFVIFGGILQKTGLIAFSHGKVVINIVL